MPYIVVWSELTHRHKIPIYLWYLSKYLRFWSVLERLPFSNNLTTGLVGIPQSKFGLLSSNISPDRGKHLLCKRRLCVGTLFITILWCLFEVMEGCDQSIGICQTDLYFLTCGIAVFDGTGQYVITGSDDRLVKFWSAETGLCLRSCRGHEVWCRLLPSDTIVLFDHLGLWSMCFVDFVLESWISFCSIIVKISCFHWTLLSVWAIVVTGRHNGPGSQ